MSGRAGRRPSRSTAPSGSVSADPARQAALDLLAAVRSRDAYANLVLPGLLRSRDITGRDAALATELGYGTCRMRGLLDAVLAACVDRALADVDGDLLDALRLGAYQLLRTRIPSHAAVAATVELVRVKRGPGAAGFVNAVLRKVALRDEAAWVARVGPDRETDPVGALAFAHAHPRWIAEAYLTALDLDRHELAAALAANNVAPPVHLAAKPGAIDPAELAEAVGGTRAPYAEYGVHLPGGDPAALDAVAKGLATVQDEGSQLVTRLVAGVTPEHDLDLGRWLDLCAGPGGKAVQLGGLLQSGADRIVPIGSVLDAVEPAGHRAELVRRACADLPVRVHVADGRHSGLPYQHFDRVLVDAPCTGLGALRRRPEARWRRSPDDLADLTRLQRELLLAALEHARAGGVVGYVTCSPHPAETVGIVADVVARTGAEQLDVRPLLPTKLHGTTGPGPHMQLWPHRHGTDAMFCAVLRRSR